MTDWELVHQHNGDQDKTERLEVPGGWLYRTIILTDFASAVWTTALTFVPEVVPQAGGR